MRLKFREKKKKEGPLSELVVDDDVYNPIPSGGGNICRTFRAHPTIIKWLETWELIAGMMDASPLPLEVNKARERGSFPFFSL